MKYTQGFFKIKNKEKYKGRADMICYRSSWELTVMMRFDHDENILQWSSEEKIVPYRSPIDGKIHRYFLDFWCKVRTKDGTIQEFILEVKPKKFTVPPKKPKKQTKRYVTECLEYAKNQAKWEAAQQYAKKYNMIFKILTEEDLNLGKVTV